MKIRFNWQSQLSPSTISSAESNLREDISGPHSPIEYCHTGEVLVTLTFDPLQESLVGNIKCSCGKPVGIIEGTSNASRITLSAINRKSAA